MTQALLRASIVALTAASSTAAASSPAAASKEEKLAYGEYLSSACVTCHQPQGADKGIPSIIGWEPIQFIAVMTAYKDRDLQNPVMQNFAGALSLEEIEALALYFGSMNPKPE